MSEREDKWCADTLLTILHYYIPNEIRIWQPSCAHGRGGFVPNAEPGG